MAQVPRPRRAGAVSRPGPHTSHTSRTSSRACTIDSPPRSRKHPGMIASEQRPEEDTQLLIAALNHAWTMYDTRNSRLYQLLNYYLVASAIVATAYASAINGKHYGLAAVFSVAGIGLSALAFAVGLDQKRIAGTAEPALITLEDQIASKLDIDSLRLLKAERERTTITFALPAAVLTALLGIGTLLYAVIRGSDRRHPPRPA